MARFLTPEWVAAWNAVLASWPVAEADPSVAEGHVTVVQEVSGTPDGDVRLVMEIDGGTVRLALDGGGAADGPDATPDVTIVLAYDDAAALSRGELSPAEALTAGRIRVRGDLSVLAATQGVLNDVRNGSADQIPATTY